MTHSISSAALACHRLIKRFDDVTAVDGIELVVYTGECFGLLGPNGAGKTTTVEIFEGLTHATAGEVAVLGQCWGNGDDRALRERLGVQLQETRLPEKLTVIETLRLFQSFYHHPRTIDDVLADVDLGEKLHARTGKLSGGQKQRLALGCALVGNPEILFLDEPTTGLDPQARRKVWEMVQRFRRSGGTVLITTHYMEEAEKLCDRVAIMDHGKIIALGTPHELVAQLGARQILAFQPRSPLDDTHPWTLPGVHGMVCQQGWYRMQVMDMDQALPALLNEMSRTGNAVLAMTTHQPTLDDVFIHLAGRGLSDE